MNPRLIYDVGMNNGDDTAYYLHKGYRVVAVEANPDLVKQAEIRFAPALRSGDLVIVNVGIAETEGELPFWICDTHSEWSSFDKAYVERDGSSYHEIRIPCRRFGALLALYGTPYYLKIDIEGHDHLCLADLDPDDLPQYISLEGSDRDLLGKLEALGYHRFQCISQFAFLPLEWPPSRSHRRYDLAQRLAWSPNRWVRLARRFGGDRWIRRQLHGYRTLRGWTFPPGSSGPFGEDLPGRWVDADTLRDTHQRFESLMRNGVRSPFWGAQGYSFWTDFHASREPLNKSRK